MQKSDHLEVPQCPPSADTAIPPLPPPTTAQLGPQHHRHHFTGAIKWWSLPTTAEDQVEDHRPPWTTVAIKWPAVAGGGPQLEDRENEGNENRVVLRRTKRRVPLPIFRR